MLHTAVSSHDSGSTLEVIFCFPDLFLALAQPFLLMPAHSDVLVLIVVFPCIPMTQVVKIMSPRQRKKCTDCVQTGWLRSSFFLSSCPPFRILLHSQMHLSYGLMLGMQTACEVTVISYHLVLCLSSTFPPWVTLFCFGLICMTLLCCSTSFAARFSLVVEETLSW